MPKIKNKTFETFNSGIFTLYTQKDRKALDVKANNIHFGDKVIGIKKYYEFRVLDEKIERVIVTPYQNINQKDIIEIEGVKYAITLIQNKFDAKPPHLQIHLKKGGLRYGQHNN